jgi:hypothetical protein
MPYTKFSLKIEQRPNKIIKIIKVFKENTNLYNFGLGNGFLGIKAKHK